MGAGGLNPLAPLTLTTVFGRTERGINALELFTARYKLRVSVVFRAGFTQRYLLTIARSHYCILYTCLYKRTR